MNSAKEEVTELSGQVPDNSTHEKIQHHLYVHQKIDRGITDIEKGRAFIQEEMEKRMDEYDFVRKKIEGSLAILKNKGNVCGVEAVLKNLNSAKTAEEKLDHVTLLEVGVVLSSVGKVDFEKNLLKTNPHDIVLTFKCTEIVVEVKRIRKTPRHDEIEQKMLITDDFLEVEDKGEFRKLISKIVDEKYEQLEDRYPNIVLIVSKDIFFRATNIQDAASEIMRYPDHFFYPDYNGDMFIKLNALFHMNESTGEVKGFPVHRTEVIDDLIKELES